MKGAFIYVNAGKGHYIPAKALCDTFITNGDDAVLENLFVIFDSPFWDRHTESNWQFFLKHGRIQPLAHRAADNRLSFEFIKMMTLQKRHLTAFRTWYEKEKPDFMISTNFLGGVLLPEAVRALGIKCPVYQYAADIFDTPVIGINDNIDIFFAPSVIGLENAAKKGQRRTSLCLCPFPLQYRMEHEKPLGKDEARKKLHIDDRFTMLFSLGGEGIADISLLPELEGRHIDMNAIVLGKPATETSRLLDEFENYAEHVGLVRPGFVNNVNEYLASADMTVGKAGANSVMESLYMKRPTLITQLLYPFEEAKNFLESHGIGYAENSVRRQADIIEETIAHPERMDERAFDDIGITFSSEDFRKLLLEKTVRWHESR